MDRTTNRWTRRYFTDDQLAHTPSRASDIDVRKEMVYREQSAHFINDLGQSLHLSRFCISTAIVYMHEFFTNYSFREVSRYSLSMAAVFLAAKVEEQPRKIEDIIMTAHGLLYKDKPRLRSGSELYNFRAEEALFLENVLVQTLGFVFKVHHPHLNVLKICQLVKGSVELAKSSYRLSILAMFYTTMSIQYRPTVIGCVCINVACELFNYMVEPISEEGNWFEKMDSTVTISLMQKLSAEFIVILKAHGDLYKRKYHNDEFEKWYKEMGLELKHEPRLRAEPRRIAESSEIRRSSGI